MHGETNLLNAIPKGAITLGDVVVLDGNLDGALVGDEHTELAGARDGGVEQVALEHHIVLGEEGDDDGGKLGAL